MAISQQFYFVLHTLTFSLHLVQQSLSQDSSLIMTSFIAQRLSLAPLRYSTQRNLTFTLQYLQVCYLRHLGQLGIPNVLTPQ